MIIINLIGGYIFRLSKENWSESWAGGLAWLRYRLDMAGVVGSNPTRPTTILTLYLGPLQLLTCKTDAPTGRKRSDVEVHLCPKSA